MGYMFNYILCWINNICWKHDYIDIKYQTTKPACFGFSGAEMPGQRLLEKCTKCDRSRWVYLTPFIPNEVKKDNYYLWKDIKKNMKQYRKAN